MGQAHVENNGGREPGPPGATTVTGATHYPINYNQWRMVIVIQLDTAAAAICSQQHQLSLNYYKCMRHRKI